MDKKEFKNLIKELSKVLDKVGDALDDMNPRRKEVDSCYGVTQEMGWVVDEYLGRHKTRKKKPNKKS